MSTDRIVLVSVFALVAACSGASNLLVASDAGSDGSSSHTGSGSDSGSGSGGTTTCVPGGSCTGGATMEVCTTSAADGVCESIAYSLLSQTFTCAACTNCAAAQMQASEACAGTSS